MEVLQGPLGALGIVLVISGVLKLSDTAPTQAMLRAVGLPGSSLAAITVALAEIVVGVCAFVFGGWLAAAAVALLFAGFAVLSAVLLRRGERSISCGCFGKRSAKISGIHVVVDAVAAGVAALAAITNAPGYFDVRADLPAGGVPQFAAMVLVAALVIAVLSVLPDTLDAARRSTDASPSVPEFALVRVEDR